MTSIARHMLTVSLFVAALGGGCASPSDTVARHESVAMATGSGGDDAAARGSGPRPDIPWWIYERARDYIVNDSIAARVRGAPAPVPIRVSAEVWCSFLGIEMIPDVGHFLYPTDRADSQHYYDSISSRLTQPCEGYRDSLVMMRLSTGFDPGRTLIFTPIDSSIAPGRYLDRVLHMKYISTGATATQPQLALADFIGKGHYEPHLRRMRSQYQHSRDQMIDWVMRYFPEGTRASRPQGSFMLWVELPEDFDTLLLNRVLLPKGVQIAAGSIFSASGKYRNCLRMNYSSKPTPSIEAAVRMVGETIRELMGE